MIAAELPHLSKHLTAIALQATERARANPFEASLVAGSRPHWHVIVTEPNRESTAAAHLVARGFGTYLPEFDEVVVIRGKRRVRRQRMFPGYLFVFIWAVETQWRRISACAGVSRLLLCGDKPAVLSDKDINDIQTEEFKNLVNNTPLFVETKKKRRKRLKRWERELERHACEGMVEGTFRVSTKSYFAGLEKEDSTGRNQILHRALGLA